MDGAFSSFPGIDRSLAVLAGNGVCLQRADGQRETLLSGGAIAVFGGEEAISAQLLDGRMDAVARRETYPHMLRGFEFVVAPSLDTLTGGRTNADQVHGAVAGIVV